MTLSDPSVHLAARVIKAGQAEGEALVSPDPIGFLGGVDPDTGVVIEAGHPLASHCDAVIGQLGVNPRRPAGAPAALVAGADASLEVLAGPCALGRLTVARRIEPGRGCTENAGHRGDAVPGLVRHHELERFPGTEPASRASQAVALVGITHSSLVSRFSTRLKAFHEFHTLRLTPEGHLYVYAQYCK